MWDQRVGAHEIDGIRAKEFFLPYGMEVTGEDFFYRSSVCLCGHEAIYVKFIFQVTRCC
jgi:hypothetical protein